MSHEKLIQKLYKTPTSSLSDALDAIEFKGFMNREIRPCVRGLKIVGYAITVKDVLSDEKVPPLEALQAIDKASGGEVFVRAVEGGIEKASNVALFGGLMALSAKMKGLAGTIVDGGTRDIVECEKLRFPVFSRSIVPSSSVGRTKVVGVNVPILCGGILVNPRDLIVGDDDGVVVIPREKLKQVVELAKEMDENERKVVEELKRGKSLLEAVKKHPRT